ncbi:MAG: hypothetical protein R3208_19700, partial [Ketobacteraceae bacterium]|nr:hypothetical protein [Ketobacteraceae bacterium]
MQTLTMEQNPRDAGLSGYYRQQGEGPRIVGFSPLLKGKVFSLQQLPDNIKMLALLGAHGKYFVAEGNGGGTVNANRNSIGTWE